MKTQATFVEWSYNKLTMYSTRVYPKCWLCISKNITKFEFPGLQANNKLSPLQTYKHSWIRTLYSSRLRSPCPLHLCLSSHTPLGWTMSKVVFIWRRDTNMLVFILSIFFIDQWYCQWEALLHSLNSHYSYVWCRCFIWTSGKDGVPYVFVRFFLHLYSSKLWREESKRIGVCVWMEIQ